MLTALLTSLFAAAWFLPRCTGTVVGNVWRPHLPFVPRDGRKAFAVASLVMMTAYTHGVLVLSLGGQVAHDLVGSPNAFVNGAVLSLFAIMSGAVGVVARSLPARRSMIIGAVSSGAGMSLLAIAVARHDLPVFLLATAVAGAGYSVLFLSALEVLNAATPARYRGGKWLRRIHPLALKDINCFPSDPTAGQAGHQTAATCCFASKTLRKHSGFARLSLHSAPFVHSAGSSHPAVLARPISSKRRGMCESASAFRPTRGEKRASAWGVGRLPSRLRPSRPATRPARSGLPAVCCEKWWN